MARLALEGITKSFGSTHVLRGVSLDIGDTEFVSLVGPSGCGKSTLLRIIAGLEVQDAGNVRINGEVADGRHARDRDLAMVFQSYALYPHLTVEQNIAVPLVMRRLNTLQRLPLLGPIVPGARTTRGSIAAEVKRVAEQLGIAHLLKRKPGQLSGGQRQRVALGRAIVRAPKAFLMDEPLSNLDAKLRVQMRAELAELHRRLGQTFVYVTHDQAEAMTMSDRIAILMEGELLQVGSPDEVYHDPADIRVAEFIGTPKINVLETIVDDNQKVRLNGSQLSVGVAARPGDRVNLAFRPERVRLTAPGEGQFRGIIRHRENLGSDILLYIDVHGGTVIARVEPETALGGISENIGIEVPPSRMLLFGTDMRRLLPTHPKAAHG